MKFGLDLLPQQRVYAGFFVYSFCIGSLPPRFGFFSAGILSALVAQSGLSPQIQSVE
jgi:hypothetical protein